jgi:hypothetical protein
MKGRNSRTSQIDVASVQWNQRVSQPCQNPPGLVLRSADNAPASWF